VRVCAGGSIRGIDCHPWRSTSPGRASASVNPRIPPLSTSELKFAESRLTAVMSACLDSTQKPGPPGSGCRYNRCVLAQPGEPLVRHADGKPILVKKVDV